MQVNSPEKSFQIKLLSVAVFALVATVGWIEARAEVKNEPFSAQSISQPGERFLGLFNHYSGFCNLHQTVSVIFDAFMSTQILTKHEFPRQKRVQGQRASLR